MLPAPTDKNNEKSDDSDTLKLDELGPIVINSDGTLSRVANWDKMTLAEQESTKRLLIKRNAQRLQKLEANEQNPQ